MYHGKTLFKGSTGDGYVALSRGFFNRPKMAIDKVTRVCYTDHSKWVVHCVVESSSGAG